jgi:hypothetical protein
MTNTDNCRTTATPDGRLSYNGRLYGPEFETQEAAQDFVKWVGDRTGLDPWAQTSERLAALGELWMEA